jgi:hypothetical protein
MKYMSSSVAQTMSRARQRYTPAMHLAAAVGREVTVITGLLWYPGAGVRGRGPVPFAVARMYVNICISCKVK